MFVPYGELRFGFVSNQSEKDKCEHKLSDFGAGIGLDFSYSIAEQICPVVGIEYLNSSYSGIDGSDKTKNIVLSAGIKFLGIE